jgi:glycine/D-amino acid oxidase-like deaminating enzyme
VLQQREGLEPVRIVSRAEVQEIVPLLFSEDVLGGSFCAVDGLIEPLNILRGFTRRAVDRGAEVLREAEVRAIQVEKGAVHGIVTNRGAIDTRCVVNASGAWAKHVAARAGIDLPVEPLRRQVAGTQPLPILPDETPMVIELGTGFHFRKDHSVGGGALLLWNDPDEPYGERLDWETSWLKQVLPYARRRLPVLAETMVSPRRCWAGLYEMTPDRHPILGPAPGIEGLYLANGFSGHGVMHSPAVGRLIAEQILHGATRSLDVSSLGLERFARGELFEESGVL